MPDRLLQRIRWANVARLTFVVAIAAVLVDGLPAIGGGTRPAPDVGLPESVLRPPVPSVTPTPGASRPPPLERTAVPTTRVKRRPRGDARRRRSLRPRPVRAGRAPAAPVTPRAEYVAPPSPGAPLVGEFGP